ncbi:MAG: cobalamin biosynthesis protein CbiD [Lachnospiraceae bacterium]|jgi:cobalt-precorrin-5B (C1)-methyltransferase|nr:cobalamin biosynthesis protein CbiD [Lachnospiraceae bacterium]
MEEYVYKNRKKLRKGFTTGTCATAAAKAAAYMLLTQKQCAEVSLKTPAHTDLTLSVEDISIEETTVSCAVRKDSGDDPDITNGIRIFAKVGFGKETGVSHDQYVKENVLIDGGIGIGRVTKEGLNQPVGAAAINEVPRRMIREAVGEVMEEMGFRGILNVLIFAPEGEEIARKTFNPRLGIEGGISILGTTGIVEPMSEQALVDTIETELRVRKAEGKKFLIITPGNYGHRYATELLHLPGQADVSCSNYIGQTFDLAVAMGFEQILLVGNIGKLVKLAGGIFQTHSKVADCRMELIALYAAFNGADRKLLGELMDCVMTDAALDLLETHDLLEPVLEQLLKAIDEKVHHRVGAGVRAGVILFSEKRGFLGQTKDAQELLRLCK